MTERNSVILMCLRGLGEGVVFIDVYGRILEFRCIWMFGLERRLGSLLCPHGWSILLDLHICCVDQLPSG